jgi:hypothetical protein
MAKDTAAVIQQIQSLDLSSLVQNTMDQTAKNIRILLLGPPKHGKTVLGATLSDLCPPEIPAQSLTNLSDLLIAQFDAGGCDSLKAVNLSAPMVDMSRHTTEKALVDGYNQFAALAKQRVEAGTTTKIVVDGVSTFDKMLKTAIGGRLQKWDLYDAMLGHHMKFFQRLQELPVDLVFICHAKGLSSDLDADQATKKTATSLPGGATIAADITGAAQPFYIGQCSLILPVVAARAGKNTKTEYAVYPNGTQGFQSGTRFNLADKEPAHLGRLLKKIRS